MLPKSRIITANARSRSEDYKDLDDLLVKEYPQYKVVKLFRDDNVAVALLELVGESL